MPTLVFDCETVPDVAAIRRILAVAPDADPDAVLAAWQATLNGRLSLKPALQQVVAIGLAWIDADGTVQRLGALGALDHPEAELLRQFFQFVGDRQPRLVGWNSGGFDLPVLINRALVCDVAAPAFYAVDAYRRRYDEKAHLDLMDLLGSYGAAPRQALADLAAGLALPVKPLRSGADVWAWWQAGAVEPIRRYCVHDVWVTTHIFAQYAFHRGWWTEAQAARCRETADTAWTAAFGTSPWADPEPPASPAEGGASG